MSTSGVVDGYSLEPLSINGWLRNPADEKLSFRVLVNNEIIKCEHLSYHRSDIEGGYGFKIKLPIPLESFYKFFLLEVIEIFVDFEYFSIPVGIYSKLFDNVWKDFYRLKNKKDFQLDKFVPPYQENILKESVQNILSPFQMKVGLISRDGVAVVGCDGYMFILVGTNDLISLYKNPESDAGLSGGWISVFLGRREKLNSCNIKYRQLIIPEKSSIIPELFPSKIRNSTYLLGNIEKLLVAESVLGDSYIDLRSVILQDEHKLDIIRKVDSHWTPYGSWVGFKEILKSLNVDVSVDFNFTNKTSFPGDLGNSFISGGLFRDVLYFPNNEFLSNLEEGLTVKESFTPANGAHIGTKVVWINSTSATNLKVICFGNSFFEKGANAACFSWWAARWFREFHFLWIPEIDYDYVDAVNDVDVVICQTIERFLPRLANI